MSSDKATARDAVTAIERIPARPPAPGELMQAMIERGVTSENVAAFKELVILSEHMEDRNAERAFASAFVELQAEMPKVQATKPVPNNDGGVRYRFAPFEDIMAQVGPMLLKHGFTISFSNRFDGDRMIQSCTLQHRGGHKRSNDFAVRVGQGPPKATVSQADGAAATYAKRFALCDALNIVVSHLDNDARIEGGTVTPEQAEELEHRAKMTNSDIARFLKVAGANSFAQIPAVKYSVLDDYLSQKERKGR